jgi:hypothetical protein
MVLRVAYLGCLCFLKIANDWKFLAGKETVIDDGIVLPTIGVTHDVVVGFLLQPGSLFKVERWPLDIVKLKAILLKDTTNATGLDPKEGSKEDVEGAACDSNQ